VGHDPELSFVVPAHDVAPYLEECLASLLATAEPIEVVVVDDGSTDATRARAEAVAARDRRVRVVVNDVAAGPGRARNRGLEVASGRHVWFVDGDDSVPAGAIDRVLDRLRRDAVDVLLVDHVRTYPSGRVAPSSGRDLLRGAPLGSFELVAWPAAIDVLHTPWNKVVRRPLLDEVPVRFSAAPVYEDLAFTYAVLRAATSIGVLAEPAYAYRTARPGALTRTSGEAHLVWADEWRTVLEAAAADDPVVRTALFRRMVAHGWDVIGWRNGRRIPWRLHRRFLARFFELHGDLRPEGAPVDLVLQLGWWPLAELRIAGALLAWAAGRVRVRLGLSRPAS
jgi:CDP-glycerol glycerophosphotransferase